MADLLFKNCQLLGASEPLDVRVRGDRVTEVQTGLIFAGDEQVVDAKGGLLLPGLHDHHIHLMSLAASMASVQCGPPSIESAEQLATLLAEENQKDSSDWLRGIGYHPGSLGDIDRYWLDRHIPDRPVRIQHRGGRLWVLNSKALERVGLLGSDLPSDLPSGIEFQSGAPSGRLFECDRWLRSKLKSQFPDLTKVSRLLARHGVTGITDTTPSNGQREWAYFENCQTDGTLRQSVRMMGSMDLPQDKTTPAMQAGEYKIHLLESELPEMDQLIADIARVHSQGRSVAIHCVSNVELVFSLGCLDAAGVLAGDRIEHASVTTPDMLQRIADLGLRVVTQPHFIADRGDHYLREVERDDQAWLYRLQSFLDAGVPLAAGSDSPFGSADPWHAMQAAVSRTTQAGATMGAREALTPERALGLYTSDPAHPGLKQRSVAPGAVADLCLLGAPWEDVRADLSQASIVSTWSRGEMIYNR